MRRSSMFGVVGSALVLVLIAPAAAQDTARDDGDVATHAAACRGEARSVDELMAVVEGTGTVATPRAANRTLPVPLGPRADDVTRAAMRDTVANLIACLNANDVPRAAAFMTAAGLRRFLGAPPADAAGREALRANLSATPTPRAEEDFVRLVAITDESMLEDGRAVAFVILNEPLLPPGGPETLAVFFAEQDGRWRFDDYIDFRFTPAEELTGGTPAAGS